MRTFGSTNDKGPMKPLLQGMRDGIPIAAGYFAVAFGLGIIARKAGLSAPEGFLSSLLTRASAGEYGSYTLIAAGAAYAEVFALCIVANLRYLLMGTALTQKFAPDTPRWKRYLASLCITDEVFAISVSYKGHLPASYMAGAMLVAGPLWAMGTACGIAVGNIMPPTVVSALGVALYGMFIVCFIQPAKKDKAVLAAVLASFALSSVFTFAPVVREISYGVRVVLLTVLISAAAAVIKPVPDEE